MCQALVSGHCYRCRRVLGWPKQDIRAKRDPEDYSSLLSLWPNTGQMHSECPQCARHSLKFFPRRLSSATILCDRYDHPQQGGRERAQRRDIFHSQHVARTCTQHYSGYSSHVLPMFLIVCLAPGDTSGLGCISSTSNGALHIIGVQEELLSK